MQNFSAQSVTELEIIDFGSIPIDTTAEKIITIQNLTKHVVTYRVSLLYINNLDKVFKVSLNTSLIEPFENTDVKIRFKPNVVGLRFTEYFHVEDSVGNAYKITVTGRSFGPNVKLCKRHMVFSIVKNVHEQRKQKVDIINESSIDATYQWFLPVGGHGSFQVSTGNCGVIRAFEHITTTITFTSTILGVYTEELVFLVLHQEPIFLTVIASVTLPDNPLYNIEQDHTFRKDYKMPRYTRFMNNSLKLLKHIPPASVFDRYLDFGTGSSLDVTLNISQTLCVTNHESIDGFILWQPDPDNVFIIDPIALVIPPKESRLFTIRFRPKVENDVYGYLLCGDFQLKKYLHDQPIDTKIEHTSFRIPCIGNTWPPCTEWKTEWDCPNQVVLPPTVPTRTTFTNFIISNKLGVPMYFKFEAPVKSNIAVLPMCGLVPGRGWQVICVALEPKTEGAFCENWDLIINGIHKARVCLSGNAETSDVEIISNGYDPAVHAMCEFPPTITGCTNYCSVYFHNLTRMEVHVRVLSNVSWLGGDDNGSTVLPPKEVVRYRWWFFPKESDKVFETNVTCSCVCLIDNKPVGEPSDLYIHLIGFSELPVIKVLPNTTNLHDVVVGESSSVPITLYNSSSCYFTFKLYSLIDGMGDDHSKDKLEIDSPVNSLKPSTHCVVHLTVVAEGAGPRQVDIKYAVLFRTEFDEIEELQAVKKTICIIWYDGIYPTIKVKRTICVQSPVILSNHCLWNIVNVDELNKGLIECRPKKPVQVNIYAPDLCFEAADVELVLVMGCVYAVSVPWSLRREKICDCEMVEVQTGISTYEMRHTCLHRQLVELSPLNGIVSANTPQLLHIKFKYALQGKSTLCFVLTLPNQRTVKMYIHMNAFARTRGVLTPLRRYIGQDDYLAFLDCGRVPINNLDPVIRVLWLYNPTSVFATWRFLNRNTTNDAAIKCLQFFAEVPPFDKLAIAFSFRPSEMIDYEYIFHCSFGYEIKKILVTGQGGLPNCIETRLDIPLYMEKLIRQEYTSDVIYLSKEHITLPIMPTHSISREILAINNDTDHLIRFIWMPERIGNIINIVMTPWWGVVEPHGTEWITITVYTLQEPATITTTVACEILDLTERQRYQNNEILRRKKAEKCNEEFLITEDGYFQPEINSCPPYVLDLERPQHSYLAFSVAISSQGQRDGFPRMLLKQMWTRPPQYDLLSSDLNFTQADKLVSGNDMSIVHILRIIDDILWEALHNKMFRYHLEYYSKEEIPTYEHLLNTLENDLQLKLSRRVTSGVCDAIVNKAVFHTYNLKPKKDCSYILE